MRLFNNLRNIQYFLDTKYIKNVDTVKYLSPWYTIFRNTLNSKRYFATARVPREAAGFSVPARKSRPAFTNRKSRAAFHMRICPPKNKECQDILCPGILLYANVPFLHKSERVAEVQAGFPHVLVQVIGIDHVIPHAFVKVEVDVAEF